MVFKIPLEISPIEDDGHHIYVKAKVNRKNARMLVDTGASRTVFDLEQITRLINDLHLEEMDKLSTGLGTNTMTSQIAVIEKIRFGDLVLHDFEAVVIDMTHVNRSYKMLGMPLITGVIGGDILTQFGAVIDYRKKLLSLRGSSHKQNPRSNK